MTEGKVSPDLGVGWLELGMLSLVEGKREETLRHFARARQLAPQNPRMPLQTAKALSQLKRPDEAIQQVLEAVRLDPNFWEARSLLGGGTGLRRSRRRSSKGIRSGIAPPGQSPVSASEPGCGPVQARPPQRSITRL